MEGFVHHYDPSEPCCFEPEGIRGVINSPGLKSRPRPSFSCTNTTKEVGQKHSITEGKPEKQRWSWWLCLNWQFCKPGTSPWRPRSQWRSAACQRYPPTPPPCVACGRNIKTAEVRRWLWWQLVNWTTIFLSLSLRPGFERNIWEVYLLTMVILLVVK